METKTETGKSRLWTLQIAENYAERYADLVSELEQLEEAFREFAEARRDLVSRERTIGPVVIGFKPIPAGVRVPVDSLDWLKGQEAGRFVDLKPTPDKPALKKFLKRAAEFVVALYQEQGIVYVAPYEQFFCRLLRARRNDSEV